MLPCNLPFCRPASTRNLGILRKELIFDVCFSQATDNAHITALDFSWNKIDDEGGLALADFLKTNKRIMHVDVGYNDIGCDGIRALADALVENKTVRHLVLDGNKGGDKGGLALANMLCINTTLRTASMCNMQVGHQTLTMLGVALGRNPSLAVLNIDRPVLFSCQEEAIEHVAMGLRTNNALRTLSMKNAGTRPRTLISRKEIFFVCWYVCVCVCVCVRACV